jgi:hypothetical protein
MTERIMGPTFHDDWNDAGGLPARAARLQAYLDGELCAGERARVQAWLARDPSAREFLDDLRRVHELYAHHPAPEPGPLRWECTLARIEAGLEALPRKEPRCPRPGGAWRAALWAVASAAVVAGVWFGFTRLDRTPADRPPPGPEVEVFAVAGEDDVQILDMDPLDSASLVVGRVPSGLPEELTAGRPLEVADDSEVVVISIDGQDVNHLVVGEPPVQGLLAVVEAGEVRVDRIARVPAGEPQPFLHEPGGGTPMIMFPVTTARAAKE